MPRICVIAVLCTLLGAGVFSRQPTVVAITGGTLIDGNGGTPEAQRVVVAEAHGRGKVSLSKPHTAVQQQWVV